MEYCGDLFRFLISEITEFQTWTSALQASLPSDYQLYNVRMDKNLSCFKTDYVPVRKHSASHTVGAQERPAKYNMEGMVRKQVYENGKITHSVINAIRRI